MKQIITLTLALTFVLTAFSQNRFALELSLFNNSLQVENELIEPGNALGVGGKIVVEKPLNNQDGEYKAAFFSTGLEFATFKSSLGYPGSLLDIDSTNSNLTVDASALFITVPITLKLRTTQYNLFTPYAQLGFEPSIILNSDLDGLQNVSEEDFDITKIPLQLPILISIGTELHLTKENAAYAGLFYKIGFTNLFADKYLKEGGSLEGDKQTIRLNNFGLRVGYMF